MKEYFENLDNLEADFKAWVEERFKIMQESIKIDSELAKLKSKK